MSAIKNRREKDRKKRKKLRDRLEAAGVDPEHIEKVIEQRRQSDLARREHLAPTPPSRDEILANTDDSLWPDDTGYKPPARDSLLEGVARPTGIAAKVTKRKETITRFQYDALLDPEET